MQFEIVPYIGPIPVRFGASEPEVLGLLGDANVRSTNFRGDRILRYEFMNVAFGRDGRVTHAGFLPGADVVFRGLHLFAPGTFEELLTLDGAPAEVVGVVVLLNLGITFSGFHDDDEAQRAVTVFTRGAYDWHKERMKPFSTGSSAQGPGQKRG